jgi:dCMP deaminase
MNPTHLQIRIEQCLALAKASHCPRRKFAALLLDPERNVVLMDGYNGPPRGKQKLCARLSNGVEFCERDGLDPLAFEVEDTTAYRYELLERYPGVPSGTHYELGCHHAEQNVICNAAANGVRTRGAWMIINGEPCIICAKLIHHAGITKVICVGGGFRGPNGLDYLEGHDVEVELVDGPKDPRSSQLG